MRHGARRRRRIVPPEGKALSPLWLALLLLDPSDRHAEYIIELQHALVEAGHTAIFPAKSLTERKMDVALIGRLVRQSPAEAWEVLAGSREVLAWFSAQPVRAFAGSLKVCPLCCLATGSHLLS